MIMTMIMTTHQYFFLLSFTNTVTVLWFDSLFHAVNVATVRPYRHDFIIIVELWCQLLNNVVVMVVVIAMAIYEWPTLVVLLQFGIVVVNCRRHEIIVICLILLSWFADAMWFSISRRHFIAMSVLNFGSCH